MDNYQAIKKLVFFTFNYPNYIEVIHWIAQHQHVCNEEHLRSKIEYYFDHYSTAEAWLRFYCECDDEIRKAFTDYVLTVFKD